MMMTMADFKEDELKNSMLNCPKCQEKFVDPRIITPCVETLCINCINASTHKNYLDCFFCKSKHDVPAEGFLSNKAILKLLQMEVVSEDNNEELKKNLTKIGKLANELKEKIKNSNLIIQEHCELVKSDIDSMADMKIELINKMRAECLDKVENYEKRCVRNMEKEDLSRQSAYADEMFAFTQTCASSLDKSTATTNGHVNGSNGHGTVDEIVMQGYYKEAESHLANLKKEIKLLKSIQFKGKQLKFNKNKNRSFTSLGRLEYKLLNRVKEDPLKGKRQCEDLSFFYCLI
jgi:hypothetical protein